MVVDFRQCRCGPLFIRVGLIDGAEEIFDLDTEMRGFGRPEFPILQGPAPPITRPKRPHSAPNSPPPPRPPKYRDFPNLMGYI